MEGVFSIAHLGFPSLGVDHARPWPKYVAAAPQGASSGVAESDRGWPLLQRSSSPAVQMVTSSVLPDIKLWEGALAPASLPAFAWNLYSSQKWVCHSYDLLF